MSIEVFDIDKGYTIFSKGNYKTTKHSHYLIEIVCCTEGSFNIITDTGEYINIKSAIIPSSVSHRFSCVNTTCDLLFLDPLSDIGIYFIQQYNLAPGKSIIVNPTQINQFYKNGEFNISLLLNSTQTSLTNTLDPRILTCIQTINSRITDNRVTLSQLSEVSFLSESRLSHLFKKQLGISVHQCILWKKIMLAVSKAREGYSLTACAHYAGFSDSAHFNKVFGKMFGTNPFFALKT